MPSKKRRKPPLKKSGRAAKQKAGRQKQHLRGVGDQEQRQYEHIAEEAERSGRYGRRSKEVAARTVMKQHKEKKHAKGK